MSEPNCQVVFSGRLVEGADPERVQANLAALFKVDREKVAHLFSGKRCVIKKGIDRETAARYQAAMKKAGALATIVVPEAATPDESAAPATPEQSPSGDSPAGAEAVSATDSGSSGSISMAPPGATITAEQKVAPPEIDVSGITLGHAGEPLVEHPTVESPEIDVSGISVAEAGAALGAEEALSPPEFDLSAISVSQPGEILANAEAPPAPSIDVSGISMGEPGDVLVEQHSIEAPEIDVSRLRLDD